MGRVLTNNTSLAYAVEETPGNLPSSPSWTLLEPNSIGTYGATITTVARNPISRNRQRRKGTITDLDSAVDWEADLTIAHFNDFVEGFIFSNFLGEDDRDPTSVSGTAYTVADPGNNNTVLPVGTIVRGVEFGVPGNNGLHIVNGTPSATSITATGLALEASPPAGARVEVVGLEGAAGDLRISVVSGVISITSTVLDFTTFPIQVGQFIHIGGEANANRFVDGATDNSGFVRVVSIASNALVVDKADPRFTFATDTGSGKTVQLFFGKFLRNVPTNDSNFLERSFQFELEYPGLADDGTSSEFEYARGNFCNTMAINIPLTDKSTISFGFIGTDTDTPTATRATNAANAASPVGTSAFNTTSDCVRLRVTNLDETGLTSDFKSLTVTLNNNVSPEKVLCNLGARFINFGNFEVDIEAQLVFTDSDVSRAVRNNTTVAMDFGLRNDDGVIMFDVPSMTIGGGDREFPVNESVLINTTAQAFQDPTTNNSIGISLFPFAPSFTA